MQSMLQLEMSNGMSRNLTHSSGLNALDIENNKCSLVSLATRTSTKLAADRK